VDATDAVPTTASRHGSRPSTRSIDARDVRSAVVARTSPRVDGRQVSTAAAAAPTGVGGGDAAVRTTPHHTTPRSSSRLRYKLMLFYLPNTQRLMWRGTARRRGTSAAESNPMTVCARAAHVEQTAITTTTNKINRIKVEPNIDLNRQDCSISTITEEFDSRRYGAIALWLGPTRDAIGNMLY